MSKNHTTTKWHLYKLCPYAMDQPSQYFNKTPLFWWTLPTTKIRKHFWWVISSMGLRQRCPQKFSAWIIGNLFWFFFFEREMIIFAIYLPPNLIDQPISYNFWILVIKQNQPLSHGLLVMMPFYHNWLRTGFTIF